MGHLSLADCGVAFVGLGVCDTVQRPAFRNEGRQLVAARADLSAIRDMTAIAQHRGWSIVTARGSAEFRREAWLAGRSLGLKVRGYRPAGRDVQELDRRIDRRLAAGERARRDRKDEPLRRDPPERERDGGAPSRLRVVEAVVHAGREPSGAFSTHERSRPGALTVFGASQPRTCGSR